MTSTELLHTPTRGLSDGTGPILRSDLTAPTSYPRLWWVGGFSMVGYPKSTTDDHNWWVASHYWWWDWTYSWSSASHLRQFLIWHVPGGYSQGQASGSSASTWTPSSVVTGDVLFYDWGGGEGISHASMQVGWGTDPNSGWYGNYVDQHTTDRRHAFWSLRPYNSQMASTTTVYFMT